MDTLCIKYAVKWFSFAAAYSPPRGSTYFKTAPLWGIDNFLIYDWLFLREKDFFLIFRTFTKTGRRYVQAKFW